MNPGLVVSCFMVLSLLPESWFLCDRAQVLQDGSLAPLLDVFGVKSTVELMEEVFTPNSRLGDISLWKHSGSR